MPVPVPVVLEDPRYVFVAWNAEGGVFFARYRDR